MSAPVNYEVFSQRVDQKVHTFTFHPDTVRRIVEQFAAREAGNLSGEHVTVHSVRDQTGLFQVSVVEDYTRLPQAPTIRT